MSALSLSAHQLRFDLRVFWRDPATVGFTVIFPIVFLIIFVSIFGNAEVRAGGSTIKGSTYYLPGIVTLGVVSTTYLNLAISLTGLRERGLLKRIRSTPVPTWAFMAGRIGTSILVSLALTLVLVALGRLLYGVELPTRTLPGVLIALVVGAASFCALGFLASALIPSEAAAAPVTNAVILPLYFISGVFIPADQIPASMLEIADLFPVKPLFDAFLLAFDPSTTGTGIAWGDLAVVAAWGLAALALSLLMFRWTPRSEG